MKNLVGSQIGNYQCLEMVVSTEKLSRFKGSHVKTQELVLISAYNRNLMGNQELHDVKEEAELFERCTGDYVLKVHKKLDAGSLYIVVTDFYHTTLQDQLRDKCQQTKKSVGFAQEDSVRIIKHIIKGLTADIWSLGVIFYQLLFNALPNKKRPLELGDECGKVSRHVGKFLESTLQADPNKRISWHDVCHHPMFMNQSKFFVEYQMDVGLDRQFQFYVNRKNSTKQSSQISNRSQSTEDEQITVRGKVQIKESLDLMEATDRFNKSVLEYKQQLTFAYQKSVFLYQQIYQSLPNVEIPLATREKLSFGYMILSRSLYLLSPINNVFRNHKKHLNREFYEAFVKHSFCAAFLTEFQNHYNQVKAQFLKASNMLTAEETVVANRLKDVIWKVFKSRDYREQTRFLTGIEGEDFTFLEFMTYLDDEYLEPISEAMAQNKFNSRATDRFVVALGKVKDVVALDIKDRVQLDNIIITLPKI